ncbi:hypothetical protein KI440_03100 [Candidatus Saccharibacteria bacterium TM7i]|nr:hypothetical protein KI440_03100 [Candidatus Saccharibacteria bacterium TM7i]
MYIALLGRQPELSIAELERVFLNTRWFSSQAALFDSPTPPNIQRLGGSQKLGRVIATVQSADWKQAEKKLITHYKKAWAKHDGKITLGLSAYGFTGTPNARDLQKTGLIIKSSLKKSGVSLRLIPNQEVALSTATSHHNKLGLTNNKVELLIVKGKGTIIIAESLGAQNITALAARDQGRPKRDAFVGMLPPKLAQMLINIAAGSKETEPTLHSGNGLQILDPFCGTGVLLQEASLLGYDAYGTDLADKMISYTEANLDWLEKTHHTTTARHIHQGDAMDTVWDFSKPTAIAAEGYLGQPFSAPPSPTKLKEVQGNCNHIIGNFLKNLSAQVPTGTPVALAVPAWRSKDLSPYGNQMFTHLPLVDEPERYGFTRIELTNATPEQLLYFRPDQVVAREILLLRKA